MPKLNFAVFLNTYSDSFSTNNPSLSNFKWNRNINGIFVNNPLSNAFQLAPGETKTLFSGTRILTQDNTTAYSLVQKALTSNTYTLSASPMGTNPTFRTARTTGADASTSITVTKNGPLTTFSGPAVAAIAASFTGQVAGMTTDVTLAATNPGSNGNGIHLTGDGTSTINQLVQAWNTGHAPNPLSLQSGDDTQIPDAAAVIQLVGGLDAITALNLLGVQVGDFVRVGSQFNILNQSASQIVSFTTTSFTVNNETSAAEGPIVLGSDYANQISIYSAAGVQIGDTLQISGGFSPVSQGDFAVTDVGANFVEFYSTAPLPAEGPVVTEAITFYNSAKQLVYLESDQHCQMSINGSTTDDLKPFIINNSTVPGIFMRTATVYSMTVTNLSTTTANLFLAAVE